MPGLLRLEHIPSPQGRLGPGTPDDRTLDRGVPDGKLPPASLGSRLLRLGTGAARRGERGAEPAQGRRAASRASGGERSDRVSRLGLLRTGLRLSAARPARRSAAPGRPRGRILCVAARLRPPRAAPARRHRDSSRPLRRRKRRGPLPPGAGGRRAALHAPGHRLLPPRPRQALPAHGRQQEAQQHLTTAATMCREMDMRFWLEQAEAEIRQLKSLTLPSRAV